MLPDYTRQCDACTDCRLRLTRKNAVFGRGPVPAPLMFVGEAPGDEEDRRGVPFVGPSGQLLDKLLVRAGIDPEQVYVTNTVKCRPPNNREPLPEEVASCRPHLLNQIRVVKPRRIVTLGKVATSAVTMTRGSMSALLERSDLTCFWAQDIPVIPVYHPAYLLRGLNDRVMGVVVQDTVARLTRAWEEARS